MHHLHLQVRSNGLTCTKKHGEKSTEMILSIRHSNVIKLVQGDEASISWYFASYSDFGLCTKYDRGWFQNAKVWGKWWAGSRSTGSRSKSPWVIYKTCVVRSRANSRDFQLTTSIMKVVSRCAFKAIEKWFSEWIVAVILLLLLRISYCCLYCRLIVIPVVLHLITFYANYYFYIPTFALFFIHSYFSDDLSIWIILLCKCIHIKCFYLFPHS